MDVSWCWKSFISVWKRKQQSEFHFLCLFNRQDYKPQNVYIVLNGRVRSVLLTHDKKRRELIGEHGRGEMVGLIEVLMEMPRQSTTIAVRYVIINIDRR